MEFSSQKKTRNGINMVPLINIVFLLLVFFMLSTTLVAPEKIPIEAPHSKNSQEQQESHISLTIVESGDIYYNESKVSLAEINETFHKGGQRDGEIKVLIKADSSARTKIVLSVLEAARAAGIGQVSLATQIPTAK